MNQELSRWSGPPQLLSETATLEIGSLKTASSVELVVSGGREGREGGIPPSDSEMAYEFPMSGMGDMTVETLGISRSLSSPPSEQAVGVSAGRMGKGIAVPGTMRKNKENLSQKMSPFQFHYLYKSECSKSLITNTVELGNCEETTYSTS